ncbi:MAG: tetratricopeptide repeat protein [Bacteroidetes bacterium]|nr:tetratricopeptide repeat protein [Bacteroidota bacterium]
MAAKYVYFLIVFCFFTCTIQAQYDSLEMERVIRTFEKADNADVFTRISDSLYHISKTDQKRFILQVQRRAELSNNKFLKAMSLNALGLWYAELNLFSDAYTAYMKALDIFNAIDHSSGKFNVLSNIGALYYYIGDSKKALVYEFKAYEIFKQKLPNRYSKGASACLNIGSMYGQLGNLPLARTYFLRALEYYQKDPEDSITRAFIYNNISDTYLFADDIVNAEKYAAVAFEIKRKYGSRREKANGYLNMGQIAMRKDEFKKAESYYLTALSLCELDAPNENLYGVYYGLADVYESLNNVKEEIKYLKLSYKTRGHLDSLARASEVKNLEIKTEFRQKAVNDSIANMAQIKVRDVKLEQKKRESIYGIIALIVVSIIAFLIFNRYRITQKQKVIIEEQKHLVEDKNKEITDSINYAKNLQDALIPNPAELTALFPGAFVIYMPKDIVAGDFYWVHEIKNSEKTNGRQILVAVADCTGHGVPGALVSVVCINALYRAVNEFNLFEPNEVLDKVNIIVNETFSKYSKQVNDGMDISLMLVDYANNEVRWSGANNKLIYFESDAVYGLKPDKQPIGKNEDHKPFTLHTLPLMRGSMFYLLTDGFSDQFGGDKNKKMGFAQFKKLMESNYNKPMEEQRANFEKAFIDWKKDCEQTDDVSLLGIKI